MEVEIPQYTESPIFPQKDSQASSPYRFRTKPDYRAHITVTARLPQRQEVQLGLQVLRSMLRSVSPPSLRNTLFDRFSIEVKEYPTPSFDDFHLEP